MSDKLILALDVPDFESAKKLIKDLGNEVQFYKIGLELMASGDYFRIIDFLKNNHKKVFADLKLYDISQTIAQAVKNLAKFEIDLLTIHSASRDIMLRASENKGSMRVVAVTVLTNLNEIDLEEMGFDQEKSLENLVLQKAQMALECNLDGVVASAQEAQNLRNNLGQNFLIVTPGIRLEKIPNDDQKRVADVKTALANGASHLVVGRPITQSENPALTAQKFIKLINEFASNS